MLNYFSAYKRLLLGSKGDINADKFNVLIADDTVVADISNVLKNPTDINNIDQILAGQIIFFFQFFILLLHSLSFHQQITYNSVQNYYKALDTINC